MKRLESGGRASRVNAHGQRQRKQPRSGQGSAWRNPSMVNREVTVLKHMLRAPSSGSYLAENRVAKVKQLRSRPAARASSHPTKSTACSKHAHRGSLSSTLYGVYLKPFALVALNTGMRRNEILGLTRRAIDWQNRMATLDTTKNGEARHVYLNDTPYEAIRSFPRRLDTDQLFPFDPNQVRMAFRRAESGPESRIAGCMTLGIRSRAIRRWQESSDAGCNPCSATRTAA